MAELSKEKFQIIGTNDLDAERIVRPNITYWQDAWRRLKKNKVAMVSLIVLGLVAFMTIFGPMLSIHDFSTQDIKATNKPPYGNHWFGTDNLGRDIFVRLWKGGRVSLAIGLIGTLIEVFVGCLYGGISGYFGGLVDDIMMRIVEIIVSIPFMITVVLITVFFKSMNDGKGVGGIAPLLFALCIFGWTGIARMIRGQVMQLKESEYVLAAHALGASSGRIILKHLIPNTIGVIIVYISLDIPSFIFAEAFLSFVGLGVEAPNTSWGAMSALGQQQFTFYPHELLFPAAAISLTMLAFNLLGDGLRDALDPKLRQ
jgi:oligopeptide transport system permease protein